MIFIMRNSELLSEDRTSLVLEHNVRTLRICDMQWELLMWKTKQGAWRYNFRAKIAHVLEAQGCSANVARVQATREVHRPSVYYMFKRWQEYKEFQHSAQSQSSDIKLIKYYFCESLQAKPGSQYLGICNFGIVNLRRTLLCDVICASLRHLVEKYLNPLGGNCELNREKSMIILCNHLLCASIKPFIILIYLIYPCNSKTRKCDAVLLKAIPLFTNFSLKLFLCETGRQHEQTDTTNVIRE